LAAIFNFESTTISVTTENSRIDFANPKNVRIDPEPDTHESKLPPPRICNIRM